VEGDFQSMNNMERGAKGINSYPLLWSSVINTSLYDHTTNAITSHIFHRIHNGIVNPLIVLLRKMVQAILDEVVCFVVLNKSNSARFEHSNNSIDLNEKNMNKEPKRNNYGEQLQLEKENKQRAKHNEK
jgi:hypothetical protein